MYIIIYYVCVWLLAFVCIVCYKNPMGTPCEKVILTDRYYEYQPVCTVYVDLPHA